MRNKCLCLALAVLLCFSLAGCHGSQERAAFTVPDSLSQDNYEITFWAKNDTNKLQTDIYRQAIAEFQGLYPNVTVNLRLYTDYGDIYNDVITNISTGTTPNVCITYPDHIATYLTGDNVVVPLDGLFTDPRYGLGGSEVLFDAPTQEELVPQFLQECSLNGHTYAVPYMRSTEACYVNKDMVEALGFTLPETLTWDFVWEVSEAAAATLGADGVYAASGAFSTFKISSYPANFLNAGQCIFAIDSTAGATWMGTNAPLVDIAEEEIIDFETEVMMVPQFDPEHPQMISQGPSICIFNKEDPQEVLYSWLFTQYLLTDGIQIAYSQTEGYVPVTTSAQESPEYQDYLARAGEDNDTYYQVKIDAAKLLLDNLDNTFTTPVFNGSTSLRDAAGQLIEDVTKAERRHQEVSEESIQQLYADTTALYHLDSTSATGGGKTELGPLPSTAVALLAVLAAAWVLILAYVLGRWLRGKRKKNPPA